MMMSPRIKAYLNQWGQRWQKTPSIWNYTELANQYINSCWDPSAAKIAALAFQGYDVIGLRSCKLIALAA